MTDWLTETSHCQLREVGLVLCVAYCTLHSLPSYLNEYLTTHVVYSYIRNMLAHDSQRGYVLHEINRDGLRLYICDAE